MLGAIAETVATWLELSERKQDIALTRLRGDIAAERIARLDIRRGGKHAAEDARRRMGGRANR